MKRILLTVMALLLLALCGCSEKDKAPVESGDSDEMYYDHADGVDFIIGRFGDTYFVHENGDAEWTNLVGSAPGEIELNDMEFGSCNADMTYLNGGVAGYYHSPTIDEVNSFEVIPYSDVEKKGLIPDYDPEEDYFSGPRSFKSDAGSFCVVYVNYSEYRLYKEGSFVDSFQNVEELNSAMGL